MQSTTLWQQQLWLGVNLSHDIVNEAGLALLPGGLGLIDHLDHVGHAHSLHGRL